MSTESEDESVDSSLSPTVCYLCRQRKTKCDRVLPQCGFCIKAKADCQYVPQPRKRGLRAGYVSQLEGRIDRLEQEIEELKRQRHFQPPQTPSALSFNARVDTSTPLQSSPWTPISPISAGSNKRRRLNPESDAAIRDLMTLPNGLISTLVDLWFKTTQSWLPILNQQHVQTAVELLPSPIDVIEDIELRALVALELEYATQAIIIGYHGRKRLSNHLRSQVLTEAMSEPSISSVRALLIIALADYGNDMIPSTFSLLSVCRRTCEQLGLFPRLLHQIEQESPARVGPPSKDASDLEGSTIATTWGVLGLDAVSTLGIPWRDVSAALIDHLNSVAYVSTPDLRDSYRTHVHLAAVGLQPVHTFLHDFSKLSDNDTSAASLATCGEMYENLMNYVQAQPSTSYTLMADGLIDFDPNLVHTTILAHATVIIFYQKLIRPAQATPEVAVSRCLQACEDLATSIRGMSDADAELNTPLLAHLFFIAARWKLVMRRAGSQSHGPCFDILMHGINMCGRRWSLARRLDIVLRAAMHEVEGLVPASIPAIFWDLKFSHLDISEELKDWVNGHKQSLYIGVLNGPYV